MKVYFLCSTILSNRVTLRDWLNTPLRDCKENIAARSIMAWWRDHDRALSWLSVYLKLFLSSDSRLVVTKVDSECSNLLQTFLSHIQKSKLCNAIILVGRLGNTSYFKRGWCTCIKNIVHICINKLFWYGVKFTCIYKWDWQRTICASMTSLVPSYKESTFQLVLAYAERVFFLLNQKSGTVGGDQSAKYHTQRAIN